MRAPGIAAIVLGAVIALSGTLGVTYRSEASTLDDPVATSASDSAAAAAPAPDSSAPVATPPAAPDDTTTSAAPDSATPSDSGTPSDTPKPTAGGTLSDFGQTFRSFASRAPAATTTNANYSFTMPNSVQASLSLADDADSGDITYVSADPENGDDVGPATSVCAVDATSTPLDCTIRFDSSPGYGLWHLSVEQDATDTQDSYVYIPPAPTIERISDPEGWQIQGTGVPGDSVEVFTSSGDEVECNDPPVVGGEGEEWYCDPVDGFNADDTFTAIQIDSPDADDVQADVDITPGGMSLPSTPYVSDPPIVVSHAFGAAAVTVTSSPGTGSTGTRTQFYRWMISTEDEGSGFTAFNSYQESSWCPLSDDESYVPDTNICPFIRLPAGSYEMDSYQDDSDSFVDQWFHVPSAPRISSTSVSGTTIKLAGTGDPQDAVHVVVDGSLPACGGVPVASDGTWTCTVSGLATGSHSFQAFLEDTGAGDPTVFADSVQYVAGGLSAGSAVTAATLKFTTATPSPTPTPTATPTDSSNWFFTITGEDLNNVHPGDKFTVTGSGLPPGATISGELHSKAVSIGSAVVQPDGSFSLPVVVPADFPAGAHTLVMTLTPAGGVPAVSQQPLKVVPASASDDTSPTPTPSDSPSPLGSDEGPGIDNHGPNSNILTHGLDSIADVLAHPAKIPAAIEIGLVLLIFAVLPGHLLNATLAEQYERFNARRPKRRRPAAPWWTRLAAFLARAPFLAGVALTTVTALLFGFADPRFGFSLASLRLFLGLAIALAIVSYVVNMVTGRLMRGRWKVDVEVNLRPLGLILTVVGVVISRLLDFSPGFLIGLVLGLVISEKHLAKHAWRAVLLRTGLLLALALLAWLAFSLFDAKEEGGTFASELAVETLVAITTEAIVGLLVELLPLRLLEGEKLYQKSKVLWGALYLVAIFIFVVAVVPWEGNWAQLGSSLWTWIGIVVGFGILATAIYIFFRVRSRDEVDHHIDKDEDGDELVPIGSEDDER